MVGASRRMRRLLPIASVTVAVALAGAAAATAGRTAPARWIVFSAVPAGQHTDQLFRIQSTGEGLKQITNGPYPSVAPAFSPNGKRIAFARSGIGIITMNADGTGQRRLTTNPRDGFPAWSPDGEQIAFVRPINATWTIHIMSSTGAGQRRLPQAPPSGRPTWTTGGLLIPSGGDLLKIDPATGHVLKYYDAQIDAVWGMDTVALSPDRSTITYIGARAPEPGDKECGDGLNPGPCQRFALYKENVLTTKKPQRVVKDAGPAAFSPNGKQLAFVFNGGLVLWSLAAGTSAAIPTGDVTPTLAASPAWQP